MYDDDGTDEQRFRGRKRRRAPRGRGRLASMRDASADDDPLASLRERGLVEEVLGELKSGKEADVLLARGAEGLLALKVHRDPEAGGFRPDPAYLEGRRVPRGRLRKVLDRGARAGLPPELALWVLHETRMLWTLHQAGVPVPEPVLGPAVSEVLSAGRVVAMRFVGTEDGTPAPRLADAGLSGAALQDAWAQVGDAVVRMLRGGVVHGDLSAWNLLWHDGRVVVIDVPQAVETAWSPHAATLFSRDVRSLTGSLRAMGLDLDADATERDLRTRAGLPPVGPFPF